MAANRRFYMSASLVLMLSVVCMGCAGSQVSRIPRESLVASIAVVEDGTLDTGNRHISTVKILLNEPLLESQASQKEHDYHQCSGVLIQPRLVLTAGHCVCKLRKQQKAPGSNDDIVTVDSSACASKITVVKSVYNQRGEDQAPGWSTEEYKAKAVKPHPSLKATYKLELAGTRLKLTTLTSEADLAVIVLSDAIAGVPVFELSSTEVQPQKDEIIMVGYGPTTEGGVLGTRHYGDNQVLGFIDPIPPSGSVLFAVGQPKAHIYGGDSGGPCFRNSKSGKLEIVGIASERTKYENDKTLSLFTSTHSSKAWLDRVKDEEEKARSTEVKLRF